MKSSIVRKVFKMDQQEQIDSVILINTNHSHSKHYEHEPEQIAQQASSNTITPSANLINTTHPPYQ